MKKLLLAGGESLLRFGAFLAVLGIACLFAPSSYAQTLPQYDLAFDGFPDGSVPLSTYIGLDRKLKTNVPGHILHIRPLAGVTKTQRVRLTLKVTAQGSEVSECNNVLIATATTAMFDVPVGGRDLGASDFTGSSGIGVQTSETHQPCIDALSNKITSGSGSPTIPNGIYTIVATLNDANSPYAKLGEGSHTVTVTGASAVEATLNLTSPQNGDQIPQSANVVFSFENSIAGRLLVFEHSSLTQSADDATRDLNSPLKVVDVTFTKDQLGSNQVNAVNPGTATRPWTVGKKYSWYFLGSFASSSAVTAGTAETKKSPIWSFTVVPSDPAFAQLISALSSTPDPVGSTFQNLANSGFTIDLSSPFYLQEGDNATQRRIDVSDVLSFLRSLAARNVQLRAGVVTQ